MNGLYPFTQNQLQPLEEDLQLCMVRKKTTLKSREMAFAILIFLALNLSTAVSWAQAYLEPETGFMVEEILTEHSLFFSFDIHDNTLYASTVSNIKGYDLNSGEEIFSTPKPAGYSAFPSFLTVSQNGNHLWAGFTVSGNTDDRIYRIHIASGEWEQMATLAGNYALTEKPEAILVSGTNGDPWSTPNAIWLLDTVENNHRKIIETGGSSAGFAFDHDENLYYGTFFFTEPNYLFRWDAEMVLEVINNTTATNLTLEDGIILTSLPAGANDCALDDSGNVIFTSNATPERMIAMWNGIEGEEANYEILAETSDASDWLTYIYARGNIMEYGIGNEVFVLGFGRPVVKITKSPPAISALPMANVMGFVSDEPAVIDMSDFFETAEAGTPDYSVAVNSFPEVSQVTIDGNMLTITFLAAGQTNVEIKATLQGSDAVSSFVVGVKPHIDGEFILSDFLNLNLEAESFWNGSDESGGFESGLAFFPNDYNPEWGAWSGWAYSTVSDNTTPGWLNQYSAITGEAMPDDIGVLGIYALTFVSGGGSVLNFNNPSAHEIKGTFITNTTYAALSMKYGDDFSKMFGGETGDDPDWFKVTATGLRNGAETGTVDYYLADYRFDDNTQNYIIQTWQWLELSSLGKVDSIIFSLSSSDVGDWGMNTPAYFALDHLYVLPDLAPAVANSLEIITVDINADDLSINLSNVFTDPDDNDEDIIISVYENTNADLVQANLTDQELLLSFTADQSGSTEITLQALSNGKTVTESFTVTVVPGTGIVYHNERSFKVYPNPSAGIVQIDHNKEEDALLTILNTIGQIVYQNQISSGNYSVDMTSLPAGPYIIRLKDDSAVLTRTLLKQ